MAEWSPRRTRETVVNCESNFPSTAKLYNLVKEIEQRAAAKGCTPSQLALVWVLARGSDIVPIPVTKRVKYLDDDLGAINVRLTSDELSQIDAVMPVGAVSGERYHAQAMKVIDR
jgi:aryl-alcohol dehydrogenase-like predicted oxidoreductase